MKNKSLKISVAVLAVLVAQSVGAASLEGSVKGSMGVEVGSSSVVNVGVGGNATSEKSGGNLNSTSTLTGSVSVDNSSDVSTSSSSSNSDATLGGVVDIRIIGDEARAMSSSSFTVSSSNQVRNNNDLKIYAEAVANHDSSVDEVALSESEVYITFKRPGKLFGLLPVSLKERVSVQTYSSGEVSLSVDKPWWAFLVKDDLRTAELKTDLEARVQNVLSESVSGEGNISLDASTKAKILSEVEASVSAVYDTSVEVSS